MSLLSVKAKLKRSLHRYLELALFDAAVVVMSLWLAWSIRAVTTTLRFEPLLSFTVLSILIYWLSNSVFRLYHRIWKYASAADIFPIGGSALLGTAIVLVLDLGWGEQRPLPLSVVLVTGFFVFLGFVAVRYQKRAWTGLQWRWSFLLRREIPGFERVLIVGAGEAGEILARRFLAQREAIRYHLVGFVDDDPSKHEMRLHDLPIFGDHRTIPQIVSKYHIDLIIIAIYNISGEDFRSVIDVCEKTESRIKVIPDLMEFIQDRHGEPTIRDISSEDLLGRKSIEIDESSCMKLIQGRKILITGAAGSIGSELCRQILKYDPKQLLLLDNNESGLYELYNQLRRSLEPHFLRPNPDRKDTVSDRLTAIVASITNRSKLNYLFEKHQPEMVFHAAAYKHVPMMEDQPDEALWVNVWGAKNLVELSTEYHVERFVFVSTDKSVQPVCIMGATKMLGELMMVHPDAWARRQRTPEAIERRKNPRRSRERKMNQDAIQTGEIRPGTLFTAVRFGNVLGSRGSVVPVFEQQIRAGGPVRVTHPDMTRYFMSITEAVRLIIQAATFTQGRDLFMLNMGERIKIDDLARRLIRLRGARPGIDVPIVYSGIRAGEKLHEVLLGPKEVRLPTKHECIFRIQKNHVPGPEALADEIDHLLLLAKEHKDDEVAHRLQAFVAKEEGEQPGGLVISYKGKTTELIQSGKEAESSQQWDRALHFFSEALNLSEGLQYRRADLLCWLGRIHTVKGDFDKAKECLLESQEISRKGGYVSGLVSVACSLGNLAADSENYRLAIRHHLSALRLSGQYNYDEQTGTIFERVGYFYEKLGKPRKAVSAYRRALKSLKEKSDIEGKAQILFKLGSCCLKLGRIQNADRYLLQSFELFKLLNNQEMSSTLELKLARLDLQRREFQLAKDRVQRSLPNIESSQARGKLAEAYLILGMIHRQEKEWRLAGEYLGKSLEISQELNAVMLAGDVYVEMAIVHLEQNEIEPAFKCISNATAQYSRISTNGQLKEIKEKTPALERLFFEVAKDLGQVDSERDSHSWLVALYCLELSEWIGLTSDHKKALITAAFLHDIGERSVSSAILQKPGELTSEERLQVKEHVTYSAKMIEEIHFPWPEVLAYVKYHHERFNGQGYPLGLRGEEIHLGARILALADFFAALTTERPHRTAFTIPVALEMIRSESGKMFDPKLVEVFINPDFVSKITRLHRYPQDHTDLDRLWSKAGSGSPSTGGGKPPGITVDVREMQLKSLKKKQA